MGAGHPAQSPLKKTVCGTCGTVHRGWYDRRIRQIRDLACGDYRIYLEVDVRRVDCRKCGKVRREGLEWLLDSPFCSKRFGYMIGAKCRTQTIQDVAKEHMLDWHTVKELDKRYMEEQLKRAGKPSPRIIGIDEISIKKRH